MAVQTAHIQRTLVIAEQSRRYHFNPNQGEKKKFLCEARRIYHTKKTPEVYGILF